MKEFRILMIICRNMTWTCCHVMILNCILNWYCIWLAFLFHCTVSLCCNNISKDRYVVCYFWFMPVTVISRIWSKLVLCSRKQCFIWLHFSSWVEKCSSSKLGCVFGKHWLQHNSVCYVTVVQPIKRLHGRFCNQISLCVHVRLPHTTVCNFH